MKLCKWTIFLIGLFIHILFCESRRCFNQSVIMFSDINSVNDPYYIINCSSTDYCFRLEANVNIESRIGRFVHAKCVDKKFCTSLTNCENVRTTLEIIAPHLFGACGEECCQEDGCNLKPVKSLKPDIKTNIFTVDGEKPIKDGRTKIIIVLSFVFSLCFLLILYFYLTGKCAIFKRTATNKQSQESNLEGQDPDSGKGLNYYL